MAETLVKNQICSACGADVRAGALFCYGCGAAVASEIAVTKNDKNAVADKIRLAEITSRENKNGSEFKESEAQSKREVKDISFQKDAEAPVAKPSISKIPQLQSAASLLKESKNFQPKKVAVVWEKHESAPNVQFILAAVFLTVLAAVILFLALRMR